MVKEIKNTIKKFQHSGEITPAIVTQDSIGVDKYISDKQNRGSILDFILNQKSPAVVGGISYNSVYNDQLVDIYGNPIDLSNLTSYYHAPIYIGDELLDGYQKQYDFNPDSDLAENSETSSTTPTQMNNEVSTEIKSSVKLIGKDGFKKLVKLYKSALEKRGINKKYAKWLASKDALETGWGRSGHGADHLNYGNITVGSNWSGRTYEGGDRDAKGNKIKQKFRAYDSIEDYIEDQLDLYNSLDRYKNLFIGDIDGFADRLYEAGYAEDPQYAQKLKTIYNSW